VEELRRVYGPGPAQRRVVGPRPAHILATVTRDQVPAHFIRRRRTLVLGEIEHAVVAQAHKQKVFRQKQALVSLGLGREWKHHAESSTGILDHHEEYDGNETQIALSPL
jgi:hypothetical protein